MKIRRLLVFLTGAALIVLLFIYIQFIKANQVVPIQEDDTRTIHVLAPYETAVQQQILEEVGEEYSRTDGNPTIVFEFVPKENMKKELSLRSLVDKDKVDIVICDSTLMPELIQLGILSEIPVTNSMFDRLKIVQMWSSARNNGKFYGVPFTCDPYVLYYRTDKLEENGQKIPRTWEEFFEWGESIQKPGIKSIGIACKRKDDAANLYRILLYSMGGNFHGIDQDTGTEAFSYIQRMVRYGLLDKGMMNYTQEDVAREFAEGKISLMIGQMNLSALLKTSSMSFEAGMMKVPEDAAGGTFLMGENIGLTAEADTAAWGFLQYMIRGDVSERISNAFGTLPVFSDSEYVNRSGKFEVDAESFLVNARPQESYNSWAKISESIADGVYRMLESSQADAKDAAASVHDKVRVAIMSG
jgi:multiple sugar transport system substrate-binding protein